MSTTVVHFVLDSKAQAPAIATCKRNVNLFSPLLDEVTCSQCRNSPMFKSIEAEVQPSSSNSIKPGKFDRKNNRGTIICESCGKRRQMANIANGGIGGKICNDCYDEAGLENEHQDGHHEDAPDSECPMCISSSPAAEVQPVKKSKKSAVQKSEEPASEPVQKSKKEKAADPLCTVCSEPMTNPRVIKRGFTAHRACRKVESTPPVQKSKKGKAAIDMPETQFKPKPVKVKTAKSLDSEVFQCLECNRIIKATEEPEECPKCGSTDIDLKS